MAEHRMDPTSRGDMKAELLRRYYEANRENWWQRYWRRQECADEFMIGMMNEAGRITAMSDKELYDAYG